MAMERDLSQAQIALMIDGKAVGDFIVLRYKGTEGLCQLYRFEIEVASLDGDVVLDTIVGKSACITANSSTGTRWFHGVVSRFEMTDQGPAYSYYRIELVPEMWLLTHRYNSRIFQDKSVNDIITKVFEDAGIANDRFKLASLSGPTREYCVQYRETDYNFISRLLEEEGAWWYFEHAADSHVFKTGANTSEYVAIEGEANLPFHAPSGLAGGGDEHVSRFRLGQSIRPGAVTLIDFDFEKPELNLATESRGERDTQLEFYDYPGEYKVKADGDGYAGKRLEEFQAQRVVGVGESNSHRMAPGRTFELIEHPSASRNGKYLVTRVTHEGNQSGGAASDGVSKNQNVLDAASQESLRIAQQDDNENVKAMANALLCIANAVSSGDPAARRELTHWLFHAGQVSRDLGSIAVALGGDPMRALSIPNLLDDEPESDSSAFSRPMYGCRFECIPGETAYRPPRVTPWPVMRGSQTASVVGPAGEEIYTDEHGRVKVLFHWDRIGKPDEHASCWIRVAQGWAGGNYGMFFLPRVGHEVIVDFLEGDPDRPIITGCVYNGQHPPPYPLPAEKTKSVIRTNSSKGGGGNNEIRFEDNKGSEQLFIQAQKDHDVRVKNISKEWIGASRHLIVGENQREEIAKDKDIKVSGDFREQVEGNANLTIDGDHAIKVAGSEGQTVAGDLGIKVEGEKGLEVTGDFNTKSDGSITSEAGSDVHIKGGANIAVEGGSEVHIKGGMKVIVEAGMQISLVVGGNFIDIGPAGVAIKGTMVMINSGGAAGSGSGCSPVAPLPPVEPDPPEEPAVADKSDPGKDEFERPTYEVQSPQARALVQAAETGEPFCEKCEEAKKKQEQQDDDDPGA